MAISLNEGSFGLLMDPLNGAADIEARTLRLVSNYGFLEEPALLIRATPLQGAAWLGSRSSEPRRATTMRKEEGVIDIALGACAQPGTGTDRPRGRRPEES